MRKFSETHILVLSAVLFFVGWYFFTHFKVVEKFDECWCRADGSSQSTGDLTPQFRRFAQLLTNSKWLVGREAGTSRLYYAPAPLKPDTTWKYMNGLLGNIALSDKYILGTNRDSTIYAADVSSGLETAYSSPGWYQVPGAALQVAVADDKLWVVNSAGAIYRSNGADGAKATWTQINGAGFDIGYDSVKKNLLVRGTDNGYYTCAAPCDQGNWSKIA